MLLNPLALPDGYYPKWQIHNPAPGMAHVLGVYCEYLPQHDDRYAGIVLQGGRVAKVVMASELDSNGNYGVAKVEAVAEAPAPAAKQHHCANCAELRVKLDEALAKLAESESEAPEDPRTLAELRRLCKGAGLKADGNKADLAARLTNAGVA